MRVVLPLNARTRERVGHAVEKLRGFAAEYFSIPALVDEIEGELSLEYALAGEALPFADALPGWREDLAAHVPEILGLARYLDTCAHVLEQIELAASIAPAYVRYSPTRTGEGPGGGAWRLLVVPVVDTALADYARAHPDAWAWTSSRGLLGRPGPTSAYAIGAALHVALAGDLVPANVGSRERLSRALRGWVGSAAVLRDRVTAALPASFQAEGVALVDLIRDLLSPQPPADWRERLANLSRELAPYRTAVRWEYEGKVETARAILERYAATAPADHVPWDVLSRLRGKGADVTGALDAALGAAAGGDSHDVRELAAVARRIAHTKSPEEHVPLLERVIATIDKLGPRLGDAGRLHFAHIEARYLGQLDGAIARLAAPMTGWDEILRETILARCHAGRTEWAHVAKLCKQARAATQALEAHGGNLGEYLVAYVDTLDGIAHYGAVGTYADPEYLADAFAKLCAGIDGAKAAGDDELAGAGVHWLHWVAALAQQLEVPAAVTVATGVAAYVSASGLADRISATQRQQVPPLVWYDAGRLLALSGAP
ncbi:MAG TPA: hypothetical protein VGM88_00760 [Kofleriaceae bacterium]